jgi:PBP1b-binding outer membrane lipoprotein LpoB
VLLTGVLTSNPEGTGSKGLMVTSRENRCAKTLPFFQGEYMKIILLSILMSGCAQETHSSEVLDSIANQAVNSREASLVESGESLDRTLAMMEQMIADLDRMNRNADAIFRAITDCKSEEECQSLKDEYIRQYEENKHQ